MASMTRRLTIRPPSVPSTSVAWVPMAALLAVYGLANLALPRVAGGGWNLYLAQPLLWGSLAVWCLRNGVQPGRPERAVLLTAGLVGLFQVAAFAGAGLGLGFGRSPYAGSLPAMAGNGLYLGTMLAGIELTRWRLLTTARFAYSPWVIAVMLAGLEIPFAAWQSLAAGETSPLVFGGELLLPALTQSGIATMLLSGGPWAAITYRGGVKGIEWLTPVLPALGWLPTGLVSGLVLAAVAIALRPAGESEAEREKARGLPAWAYLGAVLMVVVIWLNTGLLGVRPAIISGISMEPTLVQGDIVVTRTVDPASLGVGDVIRFREGGIPVIHRVQQVKQTPGGLVFVTQGDNNAFADAPVAAADVEGKLVLTIPKAGLIPISVRQWLGR